MKYLLKNGAHFLWICLFINHYYIMRGYKLMSWEINLKLVDENGIYGRPITSGIAMLKTINSYVIVL